MRCVSSCSVAVKVVRRISSAVTNCRLLRLDEDEMAAVVDQVPRVRRLEMPRHFEIAVDLVADAVIGDIHRVLPALLSTSAARCSSIAARGPACAIARGLSAGSPGCSTQPHTQAVA